jgi:hypothetical protein
MRNIYLAIILFLSCLPAGAQDIMTTATASSWSDFVAKTIKFLKATERSRVVKNEDVTVLSSGTSWSFETDPARGNYTIAILYLPRFVPAPTVSVRFGGQTAHEDKDFAKVEDQT